VPAAATLYPRSLVAISLEAVSKCGGVISDVDVGPVGGAYVLGLILM